MRHEFVAISFETAILNDLTHYLKSKDIKLKYIDPDEFLNTEYFNSEYSFINLITKDFDLRSRISNHITKLGFNRFSFVHESACVDGSQVGDGCFIYPNVTIYPSAAVGQDVIIQANTRISHNATIEFGTFIGGVANISGSSNIGKFSKVYPSCNIADKIRIADHSVIGTGTTVRKNINESGTYSKLSDKIKKVN